MPITPYGAAQIIKALDGEATFTEPTLYLALFEDEPFTGPSTYGSDEVVGGSYARILIPFPTLAANAFSIANDAEISFDDMPAAEVMGVAAMDDPTAGNMWFYHSYGGALTIPVGNRAVIAIGQLTLGIGA